MSKLLVLGGLNESKRSLEPVAEEAFAQGFGHDAEILTLHKAMRMDDERLRARMIGANVITHSAGLMAVPDATGISSGSELPRNLVIVAGPERRPVEVLRSQAIDKTLDHVFGRTAHPREAHLRVAAGNATEMTLHLFANWSLANDTSGFSTIRHLGEGRAAASSRLGSFMMTDDEFYADSHWRDIAALQDLQRAGAVFAELPGGHDELLVDPWSVLQGVRQAFDVGSFL